MKLIKLKCENCGAMLEVNKDLDKINCNFCGQEILIDDAATEIRRVEDAKLQARKANHEQTLSFHPKSFELFLYYSLVLEKQLVFEILSPISVEVGVG